jgi:hypothetical protein
MLRRKIEGSATFVILRIEKFLLVLLAGKELKENLHTCLGFTRVS